MDADAVRARASEMPREPGVYQFLEQSASGEIVLYVGKAVDIRDRVRSYVDPRSQRIARMVDRADTVDYAVTDTETQALLLEANLIKRHGPRYNVRLRDDKSYPLVQLTDHEFPRIEATRDPEEGAAVFGPFTNKGRVETVIKALREVYGVRGCSDHKFASRDRPCIDYDIGLCSGPCVAETDVSQEEYVADVEAVERFLAGNSALLEDPLQREMERAAQAQQFERAANLRDMREAVGAFHGGGADVVADESVEATLDVLGAAVEGEDATVARLHSEGGQLVDRSRHRLTAPDASEDRVADVLGAFVAQFYAERDLPDAILVPVRPNDPELAAWLDAEGVGLRVPGAGRESRLVDLALKNARRAGGEHDELAALGDALGIERPTRIEGFDVSHSGGKEVVGSNVVFLDGSPEKADYRRRKLPEGNDDYAGMRRLVRWRADRAVEGRDERPDPDLILVDGGEGQLDAAREALFDAGWDVPVISLAKSEEIVYAPARSLTNHEGSGAESYDWPKDAPQLHVCQRVRDEAHRFAVQYHQTRRDAVETALDDVEGVGPQTRKRLLRRFGSVEGVREASMEELQDVEGVGPELAERIARRL